MILFSERDHKSLLLSFYSLFKAKKTFYNKHKQLVKKGLIAFPLAVLVLYFFITKLNLDKFSKNDKIVEPDPTFFSKFAYMLELKVKWRYTFLPFIILILFSLCVQIKLKTNGHLEGFNYKAPINSAQYWSIITSTKYITLVESGKIVKTISRIFLCYKVIDLILSAYTVSTLFLCNISTFIICALIYAISSISIHRLKLCPMCLIRRYEILKVGGTKRTHGAKVWWLPKVLQNFIFGTPEAPGTSYDLRTL